MSQPVIQHSFSSGEWAPALNARVDLAKYKQGAALLKNFFVDYRGGASSRFGTKYILKGLGAGKIRLIRFVASQTVSYVLEFGDKYIRFISNGAYVLESSKAITAVSNANPCQITSAAHGYSNGDWVFIMAVGGTSQLNGNYYIVAGVATNTFTLKDLFGNAVDSTAYGVYTSGGTVQRVYTVTTTYLAADIPLLKFAQNVNVLYLAHPNYQPSTLTLTSAASWAFTTITFGTTAATPTAPSASNPGGATYSYQVTSVDLNGQESAPTAAFQGTVTATGLSSITVSWTAASGAVSYNVYRSGGTLPLGGITGYVGSTSGVSLIDGFSAGSPIIPPNFSITPPIAQNPFTPGAKVVQVVLQTGGSWTSTPTVTFTGGGGTGAAASLTFNLSSLIIDNPGSGYLNGQSIIFTSGIQITIASVGVGGSVTGFILIAGGNGLSTLPGSPVAQASTSGSGVNCSMFASWTMASMTLTNGGSGYTSTPVVGFSGGSGSGSTATALIGATSGGNPSVPGFYQQRLVFGGQISNLQSLNFSNVGAYTNFNTSIPIQDDEAISTNIVGGGQLNAIESMVSVPSGILVFTPAGAWVVQGAGGVITPVNINAQAQAYNGASNVPPIVVNNNILYVQSKGSIVRDLAFNYYVQIYTGTDITAISSHLFYGHQIEEWAHAEEPFKMVWAVREDGILLTLTYLKEQEVVGWTHSSTLGLFTSVASVPETIQVGDIQISVDAVYFIVTRTINGTSVQYIERLADRFLPYGLEDSWCVDAALQTVPIFTPSTTLAPAASSGTGIAFVAGASIFSTNNIGQVIRVGGGVATVTAYVSATQVTCTITQAISVVVPEDPNNTPQVALAGTWSIWQRVTTISGLQHLAGQPVHGVADGAAVGPLTVSASGTVTLSTPASKITLGLMYTPQLQTLRLDVGEPTIQGKRKKIPAVTVRCEDTLGLSIGKSFSSLVPMKDLVIGNVGSMSNTVVTGLVTDDARTLLDPSWDVPGQYCIQQSNPWPATILGVIPEIEVGDSVR